MMFRQGLNLALHSGRQPRHEKGKFTATYAVKPSTTETDNPIVTDDEEAEKKEAE